MSYDWPVHSRRGVLVWAATAALLLAAFTTNAVAAVSLPNWIQLNPPTSPPARANAAMAYDAATKQVVMFGGISNPNLFDGDTWIWTGSTWVQQFPATVPEQRDGARMAYDTASHQLLMFGGYDGYAQQGLSDTWTWNGSDWVQLHPAHSPPPTSDEAMAYDPATQQILIFGGYQWFSNGTGEPQQNMWAWNGSDWQQLNPMLRPGARVGASLNWDAATQQMIMFGGNVGTANSIETWQWSGTNWIFREPARSPSGRSYAPMVYDPVTAQMVLAGGQNNSAVLNDVWAWSGSNWGQQSVATPLIPARYEPAFAYDTFSQQLLLFGGGLIRAGDLNDTWLWSPFAVSTLSLTPAAVGLKYSATVSTVGGVGPATWSVSAGSLPAGLALSPLGTISGTPQSAGRSSFTLSVTDAAGETAARAFAIVVNPAPSAGVWVSNGGNSALNKFALTANGNASPMASLAGSLTGLNSPGGIALGPDGDLYVSNSGTPSVTVYGPGAKGNVAPIRTLAGTATGLAYPAGIALDASGRLYAADSVASAVTVYLPGASGNQPPVQTISGPNTGLRQPIGVTIDPAGDIWVTDMANNSLLEFAHDANGDATPLQTISGDATGLNHPGGIAQDGSGNLLVANVFGASITEYANAPPFGNVAPSLTIAGSLNSPEGVDVDAANDLYVPTQFGGLNVYAPGQVSPYAVISGASTGLSSPHAVAVVPPMRISTTSLPFGALGRRYAGRLFAIFGVNGARWRIVGGRLPRGLHLRRSGAITGIPRKLGTSTFTAQVRSNARGVPSQKRTLRLTVRRTPTVIGLKPAHGRARGATKVTIAGTGFATARNATVIAFGRLRALKVRCRSATVCTVRTPAHVRAAVNVTVTVGGLTSARRRVNRFTYRR